MSTSFDVSDDFSIDDDTLHEECGVFGILGHPDAAALTALGLHALQHRGQEAAGSQGRSFQSTGHCHSAITDLDF